MSKDFHVQLHAGKEENRKVVFEAQVFANDIGEAVEKLKKHLRSTGQDDILHSYQRHSALEIERRCNPDLLRLE